MANRWRKLTFRECTAFWTFQLWFWRAPWHSSIVTPWTASCTWITWHQQHEDLCHPTPLTLLLLPRLTLSSPPVKTNIFKFLDEIGFINYIKHKFDNQILLFCLKRDFCLLSKKLSNFSQRCHNKTNHLLQILLIEIPLKLLPTCRRSHCHDLIYQTPTITIPPHRCTTETTAVSWCIRAFILLALSPSAVQFIHPWPHIPAALCARPQILSIHYTIPSARLKESACCFAVTLTPLQSGSICGSGKKPLKSQQTAC